MTYRAVKLVWMAGLALVSGEAQQSQPADASQLAFAAQWVKAVRSKDAKAFESLLHPEARACFDGGGKREFLRRIILDSFAGLPEPNEIVVVRTPDQLADLPGYSDRVTIPVKATHVLNIRTRGRSLPSQTVGVGIAWADSAWFMALPCPTDAGMAKFRAEWNRPIPARR